MPPLLNLDPDQLLSTTRAVRKRLDLTRDVEPELITECLEIAAQAPTGSNAQGWHFIVVRDADKRAQLGERSEEHTSELQSLMRISYAVFCLTKQMNTTSN